MPDQGHEIVCVCVRVCARACVRVYVCLCVYVCVGVEKLETVSGNLMNDQLNHELDRQWTGKRSKITRGPMLGQMYVCG